MNPRHIRSGHFYAANVGGFIYEVEKILVALGGCAWVYYTVQDFCADKVKTRNGVRGKCHLIDFAERVKRELK